MSLSSLDLQNPYLQTLEVCVSFIANPSANLMAYKVRSLDPISLLPTGTFEYYSLDGTTITGDVSGEVDCTCDSLSNLDEAIGYLVFSEDGGATPLAWSGSDYLTYPFALLPDETIVNDLSEVTAWMASNYPTYTLEASDGRWIGPADVLVEVTYLEFILTHEADPIDFDIALPDLTAGGNINIDWGDGSPLEPVTFPSPTIDHTYAGPGTYTIKITGIFPIFDMSPTATRNRFKSIEQWGRIGMTKVTLGNNSADFQINDNKLDPLTVDLEGFLANTSVANPDVSGLKVGSVTNLSRAFDAAVAFTGDLSAWDVSNVTDFTNTFKLFPNSLSVASWDTSSALLMAGMFEESGTNPDVSSWDVSNVTDFSLMFSYSTAATPDVSLWNTSSALTMSDMFAGSIANPDVSLWDVSNVTNFDWIFSDTITITSDVSNWNVGSAISMRGMFWGSPNINPDIVAWEPVNVTNVADLFDNCGLTPANYDNALIAFNDHTVANGLTLGATGINFNLGGPGETARTNLINVKTWTIDDAGGI